jgi:hypothetical protein
MYCPECGAEASAGKFCPECGTDLRDLAAAPDCTACGAEVPEGARFCPECGAPVGAAAVADAPKAAAGRRTGTRGKGGAQKRRPPRPPREQDPAPATKPSGRVSPAIVWGVFALLAVIVILVVVYVAGGSGNGAGAASTSGASVQPVAADTSGSYGQLVQRANGLYDQGAAKLQGKQYEQATAYFTAAATVYAAAWDKQGTDPGVGTDYATSLFYSGDIDAAVKQVDKVLAQSPKFQTAWFNKGNYLTDRAKLAEQNDQKKAADTAYAQARAAYQKAVELGASTETGQQAQQRLSELP